MKHLAVEYVLTHDSVLQLICKYFGEKINSRDPEVVKTYCDKMCDVRAALSAPLPFPLSSALPPVTASSFMAITGLQVSRQGQVSEAQPLLSG